MFSIWKYKKYITFWELLVLRCLFPFAGMALYLGLYGFWREAVCLYEGYFFWNHFIRDGVCLALGLFGLLYAGRIADYVEAKALADAERQE